MQEKQAKHKKKHTQPERNNANSLTINNKGMHARTHTFKLIQ